MALTLSLSITTVSSPRSSILKFKPNSSPLSFPRASSFSTSSLTQLTVGEDLPPNYGDWLPKPQLHLRRRAGILLHPTSFQGPYGIGDLGNQTFRFIDWLHQTGCSLWQVFTFISRFNYLILNTL
jgi:4-alpha-glucanotransferase